MNSDVQLRYYQEAALKNVFIGGKARSGLIILPCGAGKSMVAIELIQRIKKRAIIFCENQTSATQWKEEFIRWTTVERNKIVILTSKYKQTNLTQIESCSIFITTYSMVGLKR
jgi:DNA excision repair protein ERCC-3